MRLDKPGVKVQITCMKTMKAMTIRLTDEQAEALETVASVEQRAVSDVIRAAISEHIENRRKDPAFQEDLKARLARARRLLARQAGSD
ncbi:Ribbon-helix-helix protein, copG family [Bradyrhizobium sp. Ghvi]|nr:Ribbon-helix-helix protein, copG family [Bradyrhizobium sp. Ghvi]